MESEYLCGDKKEHESWTKHSQPWPCPRCTAIEKARKKEDAKESFMEKHGETGALIIGAIAQFLS